MTLTNKLTKASVCPLDCPDTCSLHVDVRDQQITKIRGSSQNPFTAGVICSKVAKYYIDYVHGDSRLTQPMRRIGARDTGQYEPITWQQALDTIYTELSCRIARHGSETVLPFNYAGPHGQLAGGSIDTAFFARLGASNLLRGPICAGVKNLAYTSLFGDVSGMAPEHALESDVIAVWGNNATVSNLHFARIIKKAREQGTAVIVIDPKRIKIAQQADLYIQIKPGTDVVLALGLIREMSQRHALDMKFIEQHTVGHELLLNAAYEYTVEKVTAVCGISTQQFEQLASLYAQAKKLALSYGNGIERSYNGGSALRAIMSLNVLLGHMGRAGAGIIAKLGATFPFKTPTVTTPNRVEQTQQRTVNILDVSRHLLDKNIDPPITALCIYNHNPVCMHPDQNRMRRALLQDDVFIVGIDVVMTDSMRYADIILPACSSFEYSDIYGAYGQTYLQYAKPAIPAVGQSLPNTEIFRRLAKRFGFNDAIFDTDDEALVAQCLDFKHEKLAQKTVDDILDGTVINFAQPATSLQFETPSGKIELFSQQLQQQYGLGVPAYQPVSPTHALQLITPSSMQRTNSTFGQVSQKTLEQVEIHPDDATHLTIADGQLVKISNDFGEVVLKAKITDAVKSGVLYSAKGAWTTSSPTRQTVNALLDTDRRTDIAQGACYNDTFVALAPYCEQSSKTQNMR